MEWAHPASEKPVVPGRLVESPGLTPPELNSDTPSSGVKRVTSGQQGMYPLPTQQKRGYPPAPAGVRPGKPAARP